MKRWWLLLPIAIACVFLAALLHRPHTSFRFLEGYAISARQADRQYATYSFKDDYDSFRQKVEAELLPLGYRVDRDWGDTHGYQLGLTDDLKKGEAVYVEIMRDTRHLKGEPPNEFTMAEGWISITVDGTPPPSAVERVLRWIGL
jgi:hypothetical protein